MKVSGATSRIISCLLLKKFKFKIIFQDVCRFNSWFACAITEP